MTKRTLAKKIKLLQSIKPNKEWSSSSRDLLLSQIKAQGGYEDTKASFLEGVFAYADTAWGEVYRHAIEPLFIRPSHMVATLTVVFGSTLSAFAIAQNSLPGDRLYTVKKATESARVALVSPQDRSELEIAFAEKRMEELDALVAKRFGAKEQGEKVAIITAALSKNFTDAADNLDNITKGSEGKNVVKVATLVKEGAAKYTQKLDTQKEVFEKNVEATKRTIDAADQKALAVIVDKGSTAGGADSVVATHLEEAIKHTEGLIEKMSLRVVAAGEENPRLALKREEARKVLEQARESVHKGDFKVALEKLTQSKELVRNLERKDIEATIKEVSPTTNGAQEPTKVKLIE